MVVGCGGTGSEIAAGLPHLHQALLAFGHPYGIDVRLVDGDVVSETNTVRQTFSRSDIGHSKATILVNRINAFYGLRWGAIPKYLSAAHRGQMGADVVIGCVDSRKARATIAALAATTDQVTYWLDIGNEASDGQFVLGMPDHGTFDRDAFVKGKRTKRPTPPSIMRLPTVAELYPETVDAAGDKTDTQPSCSAQEALQRQEPFVNRTLASHALALLARLFRYGELSHHGGFVNLATGKMVPLPVSPEHWARTMATNAPPAPARRRKSA